MRRQYGLDLRTLLRSSPWQDVVALVHDVRPSWTETDENQALTVDILHYWLEAEYVKWTTSPAEAKKAARQPRKEPPPFPIIRPVAHRPKPVHEAAMRRYEQLVERYDTSARPDTDSTEAFRRAMLAALGA